MDVESVTLVEVQQTKEQADKVRLSVFFILAYVVYLVLSFSILKWVSHFDFIYGLVKF